MRLGFVVNSIEGRVGRQSTVHLAMSLLGRGHEVWFIDASELNFDVDGRVRARARSVAPRSFKSPEVFLGLLKGEKAIDERITVDELDVLMLRINPAAASAGGNWSASTVLMFAQAATRHGTLVLNDPLGLNAAANKLYLQLFPTEVVPRTLISRDRKEIRAFVEEEKKAVLKPLAGSGGQGVFLVDQERRGNLNQMIDAISRDGYVIAQEYLPDAVNGDTRMFLMNGKPLRHKGKYAAVRRVCAEDDIRSNAHAGGTPAPAEIGEQHLRIAEIVGPKLVQDGMFLVGLDVIGGKLVEINVYTPGGLWSAKKYEGVNFFGLIVDDLERKVGIANNYGRQFANAELATR